MSILRFFRRQKDKKPQQQSRNIRYPKEMKVPADKLRIGMRVTKLDIPWVETGFLFQGFTINSVDQLKALQKQCEYVYIDVMTDAWFKDIDYNQTIETTDDTRSFEEELPRSAQIYQEMRGKFGTVLESIKHKDRIDFTGVKPLVSACVDSILANHNALFWLTRIKDQDEYTAEHSLRVCILAIGLGRQLGYDARKLELLGECGLLHDVGKMLVPEEILNKPGKLSDAEFGIMQSHTTHGHRILSEEKDVPEIIADTALYHHERIDGNGYPESLIGSKIPTYARLIAIVDAYDAITSDRCYKEGMSPLDALRIIYNSRDSFFDKDLVEAFIRMVGVYPPGSLVELSTGETGIVVENSPNHRLKPLVMLLKEDGSNGHKMIDLKDEDCLDEDGQPYFIRATVPAKKYNASIKGTIESVIRSYRDRTQ